ncbi:MAG: hypothetical protein M3Z29_09465 [Pseudomonadota bacterium]|nr:hypothetical protein [Pseudomonadota bacterium]
MTISLRRSATQHLSHARLVLAPSRAAGRQLVWSGALVGVLLAAGAGVAYVGRDKPVPTAQASAVRASIELKSMATQLDQSHLALRLSGARSQELEHQIDALNERLRASIDEVTFFRKAREAKHP